MSGARLLLEWASDTSDDPQALFMLAKTFDPRELETLGARGIRGDAEKAEKLYARARALQTAQGTANKDKSQAGSTR